MSRLSQPPPPRLQLTAGMVASMTALKTKEVDGMTAPLETMMSASALAVRPPTSPGIKTPHAIVIVVARAATKTAGHVILMTATETAA